MQVVDSRVPVTKQIPAYKLSIISTPSVGKTSYPFIGTIPSGSKLFIKPEKDSKLKLFIKTQGLFKTSIDTFNFLAGDSLYSNAKNTMFACDTLKVSSFHLEQSFSEETYEICRICLDSGDTNDLISPCNCDGSSKYVHESCLKLWLLRLQQEEIDLTHCEVCQATLNMTFQYANICRPCKLKESGSFLVPFFIACIFLAGLLTLALKESEEFDVQNVFDLIILVLLGSFCLVCYIVSIKMFWVNCTEKQILNWKIRNKPS